MDYKFLTNLQEELALPDKGILEPRSSKGRLRQHNFVRLFCRGGAFLTLSAHTRHPVFP